MSQAEVEGEIGMSPDLAMSVIKDQAGSFEHSIREAVQNGIDAPHSTQVIVEIDGSGAVIEDDGSGMMLDDEDMQEFLTTLGESTKSRDDDDTIGQFGMGLGQTLAKGAVKITTLNHQVRFNVNEWGLKYKLRHDVEDPVDGFRVEIDFYDDEVPDEDSPEWQQHMDNLHKRFRYVGLVHGTKVIINDTDVSNGDLDLVFPESPSYGIREETEDAWYVLKHSIDSQVAIYSNGLYVKNENMEGLEGVIVSKGNLDLDFSRNDIKSGCELFGAIKEELSSLAISMFQKMPDQQLNKKSRKAVARHITSSEEVAEQFANSKIFKKSNGQMATLNEIQSASQVGLASRNDKEADQLAEMGYMVLSKFDGAVKTLRFHGATYLPRTMDIEKVAEKEGIITRDKKMEPTPDVLSKSHIKRVCFAKLVADQIGIDRKIIWGESETATAWTDGQTYIVLTEDAVDRKRRDVWVHQVYQILIHEWAHTTDSSSSPGHGENYCLDYRRKFEENQDTFFDIAEEVSRDGVGSVLRRYGYHPRDLYE